MTGAGIEVQGRGVAEDQRQKGEREGEEGSRRVGEGQDGGRKEGAGEDYHDDSLAAIPFRTVRAVGEELCEVKETGARKKSRGMRWNKNRWTNTRIRG